MPRTTRRARLRTVQKCDALVVGGGPAGLSAALVLARARRHVIVCDVGQPRNAAARASHNYLTRDGIAPREFLTMARREVLRYGVELRDVEVVRLEANGRRFGAVLADGSRIVSRTTLLATGLADRVPMIDGIAPLYGKSVHHCPYCDGYEWRDRPIAVYGCGLHGSELAHALLGWSADVVLLTNGATRLDAARVRIDSRRITRLEGRGGFLRHVVFAQGERLARAALFFATGHHQACALARELGCRFSPKGAILTGRDQATSVPRLYAAGDADRDTQFVVVAAAEGARAAVHMNLAMLREERIRALGGGRPAARRVVAAVLEAPARGIAETGASSGVRARSGPRRARPPARAARRS